jgi:acyl dehydratase
MFGSLCASGWHTGCVAMRLVVDSRQAFEAERRARGEATPPLGVSPGMRNMRWPIPTLPGDELTYYSQILDKRETKRPQWGLVHLETSGVNQRGEVAIAFESWVFVARSGV